MHLKFTAGNMPVPAGPRAPRTGRWYFTHAPFAGIIGVYRLIPARFRKNWNRHNGHVSTSHTAMAAVLAPVEAGGGRKAFAHYTTPRFHGRPQPRTYAGAWALFLIGAILPFRLPLLSLLVLGGGSGVEHNHGVSWAN